MEQNIKKYWKTLEELHPNNTEDREFATALPADLFHPETAKEETSRRDFLKYLGFSLTAASLASCEAPVVKSIPFIHKPEEITPGVANWYASTYCEGNDYAAILVKTREGRPIHIAPNKIYGKDLGAINARINASVLSLYDSERLQQPQIQGESTTWALVDQRIKTAIKESEAKKQKIVVLSPSNLSYSAKKALEIFTKKYQAQIVYQDAKALSAIVEANALSFDQKHFPTYDFSKAKVIVSFSADFLNDFSISNLHTKQYSENRNPENSWMSKHFHFEACLSITGSNADFRVPFNLQDEMLAMICIHNELVQKMGNGKIIPIDTAAVKKNPVVQNALKELLKNPTESLVVCGHNHLGLQILTNKINNLLGNIGTTFFPQSPVHLPTASYRGFDQLIKDMKSGKIGVLISLDNNPLYHAPNAAQFKEALSNVACTAGIGLYKDETLSAFEMALPRGHYLEAWNDYNIIENTYTLAQPTISALYNSRNPIQSLLIWAGESNTDELEFIKKNWETDVFPKQNTYASFNEFWNYALHNGLTKITVATKANPEFNEKAAEQIESIFKLFKEHNPNNYQLMLYTKMGIGTGVHANNPWLQELPDPVSKVTWDNYLTMHPEDMKAFDFPTYYDQETPLKMAKISISNYSVELPVFPSYGQARKTVGIALGYGRGSSGEAIGRAAFQTKEYGGYAMENDKRVPIGKNAYPFVEEINQHPFYFQNNVIIENINQEYKIACTQIHHTIMGRDSILKETDFNTYKNSPKENYNAPHLLQVWDNEKNAFVEKNINEIDLWEEPQNHIGHRWGMTIDLSSCIGCGACAVACQSENNVPVVGKDEIRRVRDLFWLRIDRYFSSDYGHERAKEEGKDGLTGAIEKYHLMEVPSKEDNLKVIFQPVMCQHCNHAPCETVCPVAATTHSNEGLNQMTYNRCVGTRYCANNCPYKVRRFNWFNYTGYKKFTEFNPSQNQMGRLVLNPDVTVRSRGVMEKCSLCVQRIQEGKLVAKKAGTAVVDGAIQSACASACPTNAITFGDLNDQKSNEGKGSLVRQKSLNPRTYRMLEEIGTQPGVYYLAKVRASQN